MYVASDGVHTAVVLRDPEPPNPRTEWDNLGKMVCWHSKYNLGDAHNFENARDFAQQMILSHVDEKSLFDAIQRGEIKDLRLFDLSDSYSIQCRGGILNGAHSWEPSGWRLSKNLEALPGDYERDIREDILDYCSTRELFALCDKSNNIAILRLYLYDHGMQSISTDSFVGRAPHAEWDSCLVGYIYLDKKTAMENIAMERDTLSVCSLIPYNEKDSITIPRTASQNVDEAMRLAGYSLVDESHIKNLYDNRLCKVGTVINDDSLQKGLIFKKNRKLYEFEGYNEDGTFDVVPIANFNPDLGPLTEETWKSRAGEYLQSEVIGYNNYFTGEVYGYERYEGNVLTDSCWGFFPDEDGMESIFREVLGGWHPELLSQFEESYDERFVIDDYLENNEFPELDAAIRRCILSVLDTAAASGPWPFAISLEEIKANVNGVLDDIVDELYREHEIPSAAKVLRETAAQIGVSREAKPRISISDLDPNKDYTEEEVMGLFKGKKSSLEEVIQSAAARSTAQFDPADKIILKEDHTR